MTGMSRILCGLRRRQNAIHKSRGRVRSFHQRFASERTQQGLPVRAHAVEEHTRFLEYPELELSNNLADAFHCVRWLWVERTGSTSEAHRRERMLQRFSRSWKAAVGCKSRCAITFPRFSPGSPISRSGASPSSLPLRGAPGILVSPEVPTY